MYESLERVYDPRYPGAVDFSNSRVARLYEMMQPLRVPAVCRKGLFFIPYMLGDGDFTQPISQLERLDLPKAHPALEDDFLEDAIEGDLDTYWWYAVFDLGYATDLERGLYSPTEYHEPAVSTNQLPVVEHDGVHYVQVANNVTHHQAIFSYELRKAVSGLWRGLGGEDLSLDILYFLPRPRSRNNTCLVMLELYFDG